MSILPCACLVIVLVLILQQTCFAENNHSPCPPSSCGKIHNITHPFRLKGDPSHCGLDEYELDCVNNVTVLNMSSGTYHVQDINYKRYEIRLTDAGVVEDTACSIPRYCSGVNLFNFSLWDMPWPYPRRSVAFLNCTNSVTNDDRYIHVNGGSCDSGGHIYAILIGPDSELTLTDIKDGCRFKVATLANWTRGKVSYVDIRKWLNQGFWLSWLSGVTCDDLCGYEYGYDYQYLCSFNETTQQAQCDYQCTMLDGRPIKCGTKSQILERIRAYLKGIIVGVAT